MCDRERESRVRNRVTAGSRAQWLKPVSIGGWWGWCSRLRLQLQSENAMVQVSTERIGEKQRLGTVWVSV